MKTYLNYFLIALIVMAFSGLSFFIAKEIYQKKTAPQVFKDSVYVPYPVPKPIYIKGDIDTVEIPDSIFVEKPDTGKVIPAGTVYAFTDSTAEFNIQGDVIKLNTRYYFPPVNLFRHEVKSYNKQKFIQHDSVYIEKPKTFWDHFHVGIGAGAAVEFKEKKVYPSVFIGGFYEF